MKKITLLAVLISTALFGCKKQMEELPKTSFSSVSEFLNSIEPEPIIVNTHTDSVTIIDLNGNGTIRINPSAKFRTVDKVMKGSVNLEIAFYNRAYEMFSGGFPTVSNGELI